MAKKVFVYPYKQGSASAKVIKDAVDGKLIRLRGSMYRHDPDNHLVVNWGSQSKSLAGMRNVLNEAAAVKRASNKIVAFRKMEEAGVPTVEFTTERDTALAWQEAGKIIYVRNEVAGHAGEGIDVVNDPFAPIPGAPLYTKGITAARKEYRLHVFKGEIILQQQKRRRRDLAEGEGVDEDVRNHDGGWVFTVNNVIPSQKTQKAAIAAVEALGLDFGAVDIIEVNRTKKPYVLEVNTACGQGGDTTTAAYRTAILRAAGVNLADIPQMVGEEGDPIVAVNPIFFDDEGNRQHGFARGELAMMGAGRILREAQEVQRRGQAMKAPEPIPAPAPEPLNERQVIPDPEPVEERHFLNEFPQEQWVGMRVSLRAGGKYFGDGPANPNTEEEVGAVITAGRAVDIQWDTIGRNGDYRPEDLIVRGGAPVVEEPEDVEPEEHAEIQTGHHYRVRVVHDDNRFAVASVLVPDAVNPLLEALYDDGRIVLVAMDELEILGEVEAE